MMKEQQHWLQNYYYRKIKKNILAIFGHEKIPITRSRYKAFQKIMDLQKDINVVNEFCETSETAKN